MRPTILEYICWGVFLAVWITGAVYNAFRGPGMRQRSGWFRVWVTTVIVIEIFLRLIPHRFWSDFRVRSPWLPYAGDTVLLASTSLAIYARVVLGRFWSSAPMVKEGHRLRTTGPYRITRHPIYTGILGMVLGSVLIYGLGFACMFFIIAVLALEIKARQEERLMSRNFGEAYAEYRRLVPQLIPGINFLRSRGKPGTA